MNLSGKSHSWKTKIKSTLIYSCVPFVAFESGFPEFMYTRICDISPNDSLINIVVGLDISTYSQDSVMVGDSTGTVKLKLREGDISKFTDHSRCYAIRNVLVFVINDRIQVELSNHFSIVSQIKQVFPVNRCNNISGVRYYWQRKDIFAIRGS